MVMQDCRSLSPLFFNIYVREFGEVISKYVHVIKYAVVVKNGNHEWKRQAGFLYADGVRLMASSEEDMRVITEQMNEC